jgi:hypothetical protein
MFAYLIRNIDTSLLVVLLTCSLLIGVLLHRVLQLLLPS